MSTNAVGKLEIIAEARGIDAVDMVIDKLNQTGDVRQTAREFRVSPPTMHRFIKDNKIERVVRFEQRTASTQ